jgi:hypothetical protein
MFFSTTPPKQAPHADADEPWILVSDDMVSSPQPTGGPYRDALTRPARRGDTGMLGSLFSCAPYTGGVSADDLEDASDDAAAQGAAASAPVTVRASGSGSGSAGGDGAAAATGASPDPHPPAWAHPAGDFLARSQGGASDVQKQQRPVGLSYALALRKGL